MDNFSGLMLTSKPLKAVFFASFSLFMSSFRSKFPRFKKNVFLTSIRKIDIAYKLHAYKTALSVITGFLVLCWI